MSEYGSGYGTRFPAATKTVAVPMPMPVTDMAGFRQPVPQTGYSGYGSYAPTVSNAMGQWSGSGDSVTGPMGSGMYNLGSNWGTPQMNLTGSELIGTPGMSGINLSSLGSTPLGGTPAVDPSIWSQIGDWAKNSGLTGSTDAKGIKTDGWGGLALSAGSALLNGYLGMQQYGLAKDSFNFQKSMALKNYENQKNLTNAALNDRQTRRNIERPDSMAAADYMAQYGVR